MELSKCKIGQIVIIKKGRIFYPHQPPIGHIIGLTTNCTKEVIPLVQWASNYFLDDKEFLNQKITSIHHNNIEIFRENFYCNKEE